MNQSISLHVWKWLNCLKEVLEQTFSWNCLIITPSCFHLPPTSSHFHPLQVENCDSNSRLEVDEDYNGKFRLERVEAVKCYRNSQIKVNYKIPWYFKTCPSEISHVLARVLSISHVGATHSRHTHIYIWLINRIKMMNFTFVRSHHHIQCHCM